jgi:hypothetical protein
MNTVLYGSLLLVAAFCLLGLTVAVGYQVLFWLVGALWTLAVQAVRVLAQLFIHALSACGRGGACAAAWLARLCWEGLATLAVCLFTPLLSWIARRLTAFREWMKLRSARVVGGDAPEEESAESPPADDDPAQKYKRALEILGFAEDEDFSQADLRDRYRRMLNAVHPDKGFTNNYFAQQINEAVLIIKRWKKWK